ncbi:Alpha-alpha-trehalose-phosphate synthase [Arabidopsis thaliana x Arabidopsis arenosa]|uniref:alpha,alpha-trehalose-phosphate synthase (UDP-forming) n=1 Tax=Arabidopsis thaliana x Arabidopsis arenosa TaxID=1240361 RepID=A0A8T2C0H1_9BRAS|nr:Alpha-alpha-trehalose-phosphate synthase [Arabidopsis thaliana x Arabidopsis arenosa]
MMLYDDARGERPRLLVVANRLPVSAKRTGENSWSLEMSPGGLVSGLLGVTSQFDTKWVGWPGVDVYNEVEKNALTKSLAEMKCIPVFLNGVFDQYYNGYCNGILWPILHHMGLPQEDQQDTNQTFETQYDAYKKANRMFLDVIIQNYEEGDTVWCHDYHLMFLPQYLKEHNNKIKVGWFLHSPFPSSEVYKTLPSRSELLRAILTADLLGFHTYDFVRHFLSTCTRILGVEGTNEGVVYQGRVTRVAVFPIGIDPDRFIRTCKLPEVTQQMNELKERFAGKKVILGVDRLDMIKGIPQKYLAFEKFLEENPYWRDKVVLVQIAVPTRNDVPEYRKLKSQVHGLVGRINGRFGSVSSLPIHHLDCSVDFNYLCALYAIADVMLVTSLRDGMNLVSYEFVACQEAKKGVLVLSEFAGAGQSLGVGALLVNPWDVTEVSSAIKEALNMPAEERETRHKFNFQYVYTHSAKKWGSDFMSELNDTIAESELQIRNIPLGLPQQDVIQRYLQSNNRLIILGFCGTLTEQKNSRSKEMDLKLNPELKGTLKALCNDPKTTVVVLSRSDKNILDKNFGGYNIWLAAENGMFEKHTTGEWVTNMPQNMNLDWVDSVKNVFNYFTDRTPRSFVKSSETSLVWNYEFADVEFGRAQARDLLQYLWAGPISNASVDVVRGNHSVEVHAIGETKGTAIGRILGDIVYRKSMTTPIDFVFCSGYFLEKDEDIYTFFESKILSSKLSHETRSKSSSCNNSRKKKKISMNVLDLKKENYFSAAIGQARTKARYVIDSSLDVVDLLHKLAVVDTTMTDSFSDSELYEPRNENGNANSKRWTNSVRRRKMEIGDTGQIGM